MIAETLARTIDLPAPVLPGKVSVEEALRRRRSVRDFDRSQISLGEVAQILWSCQGVTTADGRRTAPSAGALYPLEIFLVVGRVGTLSAGVYRYDASHHRLEVVVTGDRRAAVMHAALGQEFISDAPAVLVITGVYGRTARKYGGRAERYVHLEAGCAAQNVALEAAALGLGTVVVGAFNDAALQRAIGLRPDEQPLIVMPIGRPAGRGS